jgi:8-oxo-dGTP diphosphatase
MGVSKKKLMVVGNWAFVHRDKKILLLKRSEKEVLGGGAWSVPGGKSEKGSDCFANLKKEVLEEAGVEFEEPEFLLHKAWPRQEDWVMGFFWVAKYKSGGVRLNHEHTEFVWATEEEAEKLETTNMMRQIIKLAFKRIK